MKFQHPAIARAVALQARFLAHAPKPVPVADETDSTPATLLEVETHNAECEYLVAEDALSRNPELACADYYEMLHELYANWNCFRAQLENQS